MGLVRDRVACRWAVLAVALLAALAQPTAAGAAGWSRPFRFEGPLSGDVVAPQLAVSASGQAALAFVLQDEDHPWVSQAMLALRSARGRLSRLRVPGAKAVLDEVFAGRSLELLTGSGPPGQMCCSAVQSVAVQGTAFVGRRTLLTGLTGATFGRVLTLPGSELLAALATDRAVWVGRWQPGTRAGRMRRLSAPSSWPQALSVAALSGGSDAIVWSGAPSLTEGASSVLIATGTQKRPPRGPRLTVNLPAGHAVDEVAVGARHGTPTVAWIESWSDFAGAYHSQLVVVDGTRRLLPRTYEFPGEVLGGLVLVADAAGDQVLAARTCDQFGSCGVLAFSRGAHGYFGQPQALGAIDASQQPAAGISARGAAVVGWIDGGEVVASGRRGVTVSFSAPRAVPATSDAGDLTLAFGPGGQAMAAWDQGTLAPSVMGASYTP